MIVRTLLWKLGGLLATLFMSSVLIFASVSFTGGDPVAALSGGRALPPAARAAIRRRYHLNDPPVERYLRWIDDVVHGRFGESAVISQSVSSLIAGRLPTTLTLVAMAAILVVAFGAFGGALAGFRGGILDSVFVPLTVVASSIPSFVGAIATVWLFSVELRWLPAVGSGSGFGMIRHLTLPAISLAIAYGAYVGRVARATVRSEMNQEYVETAHARGMPRSHIFHHHVLRNAVVPISTITAVTVLGMMAGAVVVEQAFALNGIGSLLVSSVQQKDFAVVQAIALLLVATFGIVNVLIDVLSLMLDPRLATRRLTSV